MTEPFYLTEGKGYWPDDEILFWICPKCGQTNSSKNLEPITAKCSNCASTSPETIYPLSARAALHFHIRFRLSFCFADRPRCIEPLLASRASNRLPSWRFGSQDVRRSFPLVVTVRIGADHRAPPFLPFVPRSGVPVGQCASLAVVLD